MESQEQLPEGVETASKTGQCRGGLESAEQSGHEKVGLRGTKSEFGMMILVMKMIS